MVLAALPASVASGDEIGLPPQLRATTAYSDLGMVATGSTEATEAAVTILERGGSAVDAAVAAALVLGVSDSDASGIGGMTYMVIRLAGGHAVAIDGTAYAPGSLDLEGLRAAKQADRDFGYEMVAVPTTLAVLDLALRTYGTISMAEALGPAIEVATHGYRLSPIQIAWTRAYHEDLVVASDYLRFLVMKDGETIGAPGDLFCNHDLAGTLREIARDGVDSFYRGSIAARIEADMVSNGGSLRRGDLAMLRVRRVSPMTTTYRGVEVLTVPPPGGGDSLVGTLDILETFPAAFLAEDSLARHHVFIETARIALAGRASAGAGLLMAGGLPATQGQRKAQAPTLAQMIVPGTALPKTAISGPVDPDCLPEGESTTQVSIIDSAGNVVSLTQTLGQSYGAKVATPGLGFIYNNFLSSFKVDKPHCPGYLRPRGPCPNDMAPTILVYDSGRVSALGTPGSSRIPSILASVISNMLDGGMGLGAAIEAPRILWEGGKDTKIYAEIAGLLTDANVDAFNAMGYEQPAEALHFPADPVDLADFGGVNAVTFDPISAIYAGVVDPRRGGLALGPRVIVNND
jgi:gamma-glutamyltranspeptidase/glutathione hydrolase